MKNNNQLKEFFRDLEFVPKQYLVKILTVVISLSIILDILRGNYLTALKDYMLVTITFWLGSLIAFWSKKILQPVTPWKAFFFPLGVFSNSIRRWMFK